METFDKWAHPYTYPDKYSKRVAYFSMEFGIHQPLKIFSGGLGFLAGSHMRSAYDLKQNVVGVGMIWKYGYYDQIRTEDRSMTVQFRKKFYTFLEDTGIIVPVYVNQHQVLVKALYLRPEIFNTVPLYLLTTNIKENDHLAQSITNKLYDSNTETRIVQNIVLGIGGAKVIDAIGGADIYHMNEGHALALAFHLYSQHDDIEEVRKRVVFTTHTPEKAGNEEHDINLMHKLGFFADLELDKVRELSGMRGHMFGYTPAALRLSKIANGVSQLHGEVSRDMWSDVEDACQIAAITNSQNQKYWGDTELQTALDQDDDNGFLQRKKEMKKNLLELVADKTGKLFDDNVLTIVWARRFAMYKRADLIMRDLNRFIRLITDQDRPIQIIWAGKPYPLDSGSISVFNHIQKFTYRRKNCAVLTGYEMGLSALLKKGADVWLNTPRRPREASGTSGMTAAMNGAVNFSTLDGWMPEFAKHGKNSFVIPPANPTVSITKQDNEDHQNLMKMLEDEVIPAYYDDPERWLQIMKQSMSDICPMFDSNRMADEYYQQLYNYDG